MNQQTEPRSSAKEQSIAMIFLLITTVLWGSTFIITNKLTQIIPPMFYMFLRYIIGFIAFLPFMGRLRNFTKKQFKIGFIAGTLVWASFSIQTIGIQLTTATKSAFITGLSVIMVPIFYALFFKDKISARIWISTLLALIGVSVMSIIGFENVSIGDLLVLISDVFYALYIIYLSLNLKSVDIVGITVIIVFLLSFYSLIASLIFEDINLTFKNMNSIFENFGLILLYMGVCATNIATLTQNYGQRHLSSTKAAIIFATEPLFATFFAVLGGESLTPKIVIGGILILVGVLLSIEKPELDRSFNPEIEVKELNKG